MKKSALGQMCASRRVGALGRHLIGVGTVCLILITDVAVSLTLAQPTNARKITIPRPPSQAQARALALPNAAGLVAPLDQTFLLSSRPTATKTIYLDFNGHTTENTGWNDTTVTKIVTTAMSTDSNPNFSNSELAIVQDVWARVSEIYSPFDINVTTKEPPLTDLQNAGSGDTRWGIRVIIGVPTPSPAEGAAGVAILSSFTSDIDNGCFVFSDAMSNFSPYIALGAVHEVGHTLGLTHDGRTSPVEAYYTGQGTGLTAWAPIMGAGYDINLIQWSKGEYLNANNQQDDLQIITTSNGFTYRVDDFPNSSTTAAVIGGTKGTGTNAAKFFVAQSGVIERTTDTDWFKFVCDTGVLSLSVAGGPVNSMLDAKIDVYNSVGQLVISSNPTDLLTASINQSIPAGTYFVSIDGVGKGNVLGTGYSDYSSLGQYTISGSYQVAAATVASNVNATYVPAQRKLTLTGDGNGNSVSVTYTSGVLKVEGANGTKINTTQPAVTFSHPSSDKLIIAADLGGGNDAISFTGVNGGVSSILLGNGDDKAAFTLSNFTKLTLDGGAGTDTYIKTSSTFGELILKFFP